MNYYDLLEHAELLAINAAISPTAESIYRMKCRAYSQQFHTPLHLVYELDQAIVLQALYEDKYHPSVVEEELEELLEKLRKIEDPSYTRLSDAEVEDLVDAVINHENKRKGNKPKKKTSEKTLLEKNTSEIVDLPTPPKSGGMSFGDLEKSDEASESGRSGF
jgi:hypothetical protein